MRDFSPLKRTFSQKGMTLIEVMIALAIFAIFITAFMNSQGNNILDSESMRKETKLRTLAQKITNETINDPPELKESLTLKPEKKTFKDHSNFRYEIEYKKFEVEEILKSLTQPKEDDAYRPEEVQRQKMQEKINKKLAENMEKLVWQMRVTVFDKTTGENFSLSTFLYNHEAKVKLGTL